MTHRSRPAAPRQQEPQGSAAPFTALVLAGERTREGSLAKGHRVPCKALVPVAGRPMIEWVIEALWSTPQVGRIVACGLPRELAGSLRHPVESLPAPGPGPAGSLLHALKELRFPVLVTTADHPLLRPPTVAAFCQAARERGADLVAGVVEAGHVRQAFPESRRTFIRLRDATVSGANLFALFGERAAAVVAAWAGIERHRKRPWRLVMALGPVTVARFLLGRLSVAGVRAQVRRKLGATVELVLLDDPRAAVDVDSESDRELAERILLAG